MFSEGAPSRLGGGGGKTNMNGAGMLVVSLTGVKFRILVPVRVYIPLVMLPA